MARSKKRKRSSAAPGHGFTAALERLQLALGLSGSSAGIMKEAESIPEPAEVAAMSEDAREDYAGRAALSTETALEALDIVLGWQSRERAGSLHMTNDEISTPVAESGVDSDLRPTRSTFNTRALIIDLARHKDSQIIKQYSEMALWKRVRLEGQRMNRIMRDSFAAVGYADNPTDSKKPKVPFQSFLDAYMGEITKAMEGDLDKLRVDESMGDVEVASLLDSMTRLAKVIPEEDRQSFVHPEEE